MSDAPDAGAAKKKGGGKKKLIIILGAVALLGGGGAAAGFFAAGSMHKESGPAEDAFRPQLVLTGEKPEEVAKTWAAKAAEQHAPEREGKGVDLPRPANASAYQATYFQIPAPFTSNLADSDSFAQVSIAVSTYYDQRVIEAVQAHELPIRSAILMMMAQEQELDLSTPQGKEKLQAKLLTVINDVLKEKTGYGGIDNVYFTNFVIQ
ncbi:flagellar FliL protein [Sphingobium sp. B2D3A]|uniref:flagellar basal body-associated FliL family protein n=1 Tax=unclassified Sphingobium TaxID=2611147 RepID=UPI002224AC50|nr:MULTISPECIES: flagellar basal body-associated FliL family protein [unclassified Sphingobium]MCW2336209.1 flagellar FliL protein [Sphingobium sp. B2D3A]MCW2348663.1 flagellar FliL protein [Sphingobium sp. B12D2B]MCW2364903.1 flagellar FliL protein [Sphingobium sp. B7D2B]MCW2371077.1 flagellar FliL protein [Sphingobium sp. B11D3D]MCW2385964.1 flagellar FliL protein [Sphingobium sp. B2D3D]